MSLRDSAAETIGPLEIAESAAGTAADVTYGNSLVRTPQTAAGTSGTTDEEDSSRAADRVVRLPPVKRVTDLRVRFVAMKEWEGRVTSVDRDADVFWAGLIDLTSGDTQEFEQAEFSFSNVQDYDRDLVRPGAIFRWVIGTRFIAGTKERSSRVIFRRLPAWSKSDIERIEREADALESLIRRT